MKEWALKIKEKGIQVKVGDLKFDDGHSSAFQQQILQDGIVQATIKRRGNFDEAINRREDFDKERDFIRPAKVKDTEVPKNEDLKVP